MMCNAHNTVIWFHTTDDFHFRREVYDHANQLLLLTVILHHDDGCNTVRIFYTSDYLSGCYTPWRRGECSYEPKLNTRTTHVHHTLRDRPISTYPKTYEKVDWGGIRTHDLQITGLNALPTELPGQLQHISHFHMDLFHLYDV